MILVPILMNDQDRYKNGIQLLPNYYIFKRATYNVKEHYHKCYSRNELKIRIGLKNHCKRRFNRPGFNVARCTLHSLPRQVGVVRLKHGCQGFPAGQDCNYIPGSYKRHPVAGFYSCASDMRKKDYIIKL